MTRFLTPILTENRGEIAFAAFLKEALGDDYLCWHEVAIKSPKRKREKYPDFILFNPRLGFWILEVKDWSLSYICGHNPKHITLATGEVVLNPHQQAQYQAFALKDLLKTEAKLKKSGRFIVPITWASVFTNLTQQEFENPNGSAARNAGTLGNIPVDRAFCAEGLTGKNSAAIFEERLWAMIDGSDRLKQPLNGELIELIRDLIFPDVRITLSTTASQAKDSFKPTLIDYEQEQVFHSLRTGAHIIFGVAGSGKTILLLNKARQLLEEAEGSLKPHILYLCRGTCVAEQVRQQADKIGVPANAIFSFHKWCRNLLKKNGIADIPDDPFSYPAKLISEFRKGTIAPENYDAIFLDEGHDFKDRPEWLKLIAAMRKNKDTLFAIAYDEAQAIYEKEKQEDFDLGFLGVGAAPQKHILRKNYRNTEQILLFAKVLADFSLRDAEDEKIPKVRPIGHGSNGALPVILECASFDEEIKKAASEIQKAHAAGKAWPEIAVLFHTHDYAQLKGCAFEIERRLRNNGVPCSRKETDFGHNVVKVMSITKAKGLGFSMVCIVGVGETEFGLKGRDDDLNKRKEHLEKDIHYLYNAITRALDHLVVTYTKPTEKTLADRRVGKLITALSRLTNSEHLRTGR